MERTRIQLADGVYLTYLPARKFKTSLLSAQFVTPLQQETASAYALLPAILRRGTVRYNDMCHDLTKICSESGQMEMGDRCAVHPRSKRDTGPDRAHWTARPAAAYRQLPAGTLYLL